MYVRTYILGSQWYCNLLNALLLKKALQEWHHKSFVSIACAGRHEWFSSLTILLCIIITSSTYVHYYTIRVLLLYSTYCIISYTCMYSIRGILQLLNAQISSYNYGRPNTGSYKHCCLQTIKHNHIFTYLHTVIINTVCDNRIHNSFNTCGRKA